jgi:hypothetical protein
MTDEQKIEQETKNRAFEYLWKRSANRPEAHAGQPCNSNRREFYKERGMFITRCIDCGAELRISEKEE